MILVETGIEVAMSSGPRSPLWTSTPRTPQYSAADEEMIGVALSLLGGCLARPAGVAVGPEVLHAYLRLAMHGLRGRRLDLLCFDALGRMVRHMPLFHGDVVSLRYKKREIVREARRARAHSAVLAEWHCSIGAPVICRKAEAQDIGLALELVGIGLRTFCQVGQDDVHVVVGNPPRYRRSAGVDPHAPGTGECALIARARQVLQAHTRRPGDLCDGPQAAFATALRLAKPVTGPRVDLLWLDERLRALGCDSIGAFGSEPGVKQAMVAACERDPASLILIDHVRGPYDERERFALADALAKQLALIDVHTVDVLLSDGIHLVSKVGGEVPLRRPAT